MNVYAAEVTLDQALDAYAAAEARLAPLAWDAPDYAAARAAVDIAEEELEFAREVWDAEWERFHSE